MIATKNYVRNEIGNEIGSLKSDLAALRSRVGEVPPSLQSSYYNEQVYSWISGTSWISGRPIAPVTVTSRLSNLETRLDRLFAYLGVIEKTDSARTYVAKKPKRGAR